MLAVVTGIPPTGGDVRQLQEIAAASTAPAATNFVSRSLAEGV